MSQRPSQAIGLFSLVCLVIGNMIGAGVYISTSYALGALQDARIVLLAWAIGGVHAICGAVAYAALARRAQLSGGEYTFLSQFVHPAIGFMAGWISIIAGFTAPIATAALLFGEYALGHTSATTPARALATLGIALGALFHCINLKTGSLLNNAVVVLKFVGFFIFIAACTLFLTRLNPTPNWTPALNRSIFATDYLSTLANPAFLQILLIQLFFISLAYTGFNASIYIAGELPADDRRVPNSMVLACCIVTLIYLVLNTLFLACASSSEITQGGDYFVSKVAENVGGYPLQWIMRATIALSSATSVLAMLATGPRVIATMAQDGWLPKALDSKPTPKIAILVQASTSILIVWMANLLDLISYLGLTLTLCGALATATLWFAYREMNQRRSIQWWEHAALALYISGALILFSAAWWVKQEQFWLTLGTFASGILVYLISNRQNKSSRLGLSLLGMSILGANPGMAFAQEPANSPEQSPSITQWLDQLDAPTFEQRQQAFLALLKTPTDISAELETGLVSGPPVIRDSLKRLRVLRSIPASNSTRLDAMSIFLELEQGSPFPLMRNSSRHGNLQLILPLVEALSPKQRDAMKGFEGISSIYDPWIQAAARDGNPEPALKLIDLLLPDGPIRIGLPYYWKKLGLPSNWTLTPPTKTKGEYSSDVRITQLVLDGNINAAIALADKDNSSSLSELLRIRFARWDEWMAIDPRKLQTITPFWSDIPKGILLESLDRHDEALAYYQARGPLLKSKQADQQVAKALLAQIVGDQETVDAALKANSPKNWRDMLFLQNRIDELLDFEGLKERTPESIDVWLEKNLELTNGIETSVRFMALFHRIGEHSADKAVFDALLKKFDSPPDETRWALWTDYFQHLQRFGLDERRQESMVRALRNWNPDTEMSPQETTQVPGFPQSISAPPVTPSRMFAKAYPFIPISAYRVYYALHRTRPDLSLEDRIEILEALNAGRKPQSATINEKTIGSLIPLLQQALTITPAQESTNSNSTRFAADGTIDSVNSRMACELADALNTMGETQHAANLLDAFPNSLYASIEKAHLLKKLGRISEAIEIANETLQLNTRLSFYLHTRAAKLLRDCGEHTAWLAAQQLYASQVKPWANFAESFQDTPPAMRPELEPEVEHLLINQWDSCAFLWTDSWTMETILSWNILGLGSFYHDSATKHPERIGLVAEMNRASCIFEISLILQSAFISTNTSKQAAANFMLDWNRLCSIFSNTLAAAFWQAVLEGDEARAERLLLTSHRLSPEEINTFIDAIPLIRKSFGNETLERWFHIYYDPMLKHLETYPDDLLIGNNAAWLCAKCELDVERGYELAKRVTARDPSDTFLDTLAELEFVRGNRDGAIELSLKCKSLNPRDPHHARQIRRYSESTELSKP